MTGLLSILFSILLATQSFSLTPSEYQHLSVKCLKPIFEDLPSESEYYKNLSEKEREMLVNKIFEDFVLCSKRIAGPSIDLS